MDVSLSSYGNYSSSNYGAHCLEVRVGNLTLYFSYRTVVAFHTSKTGTVVRQNDWGATTGKHLNWIDSGDKKSRVNREVFEQKLNEVLREYDLTV